MQSRSEVAMQMERRINRESRQLLGLIPVDPRGFASLRLAKPRPYFLITHTRIGIST